MRHLLCFIILFSLTFSLCEAAVVDPDLQAILQGGPSNQEVPVIINLADRVDVNQIPIVPVNNSREGKKHRRHAFATALKDKADKTQGPLQALLQGRGGKHMKSIWLTNSVAVTVPASVISELSSLPEIASIELDAIIQAPLIEPSTTGTPQWNMDRINTPALWTAGIDGTGVVVASLDSGVDVNHPDLKYRWRGGSCSSPPNCPSWFDPYNNTTVPYGIPLPGTYTQLDVTHIHGTHVMGIMVGGSASHNAIGVAPGAKWISAKIFDDATGSSTNSIILSALQWVLQPAGDAANAPDVVNNSWVLDPSAQNVCDTSVLTAISNLTAAGIEVIFAAGNVNPPPGTSSTSFSPANNAGVFAVGATDFSNVIAPFSAWGPSACDGTTPSQSPARTTNFPNIVAPGTKAGPTGIWSSVPLGTVSFVHGPPVNYLYFQGTSMAAPHVTGAAALLVGAMPALTPAQIEEAFEQSALPLGSSTPNDTYGYGLLNVESAYKYAFKKSKGDVDVSQIAGPSSLSFINVAISDVATFLIVNQGTADLTITGISIVPGMNSGDFTITNNSCSSTFPFIIPSLLSCSITVSFTPGAPGRRSAQLSVSSDDGATPILNVPLSGNDPVALIHNADIVATYSDIQTASNDCSNWDTIRIQAVPLTDSPVFNLPLGIAVSLQGGYDAAFGSQSGFTTVEGTLTISKGTVTVENVIIQ